MMEAKGRWPRKIEQVVKIHSPDGGDDRNERRRRFSGALKAKITGGAAGLPNVAGDRREALGDGGVSSWRSMSPGGYPPPAICSCCGTGAG